MHRSHLAVVALLVWTAAAHAEDAGDPVEDLVQVVEVDAPIAEVWEVFTTKEGAEQWMAPLVEVDLRTGGTIRTNYDRSAGIGGPGTIVHRILALDAPHLAVMQTVAPEGNPYKDVIAELTGTWRFEALGPDRTRLVLGTHGWPQTPEARQVRAFFEKANPGVLAKLASLFPAPPSADEVRSRLSRLVGSWDATLSQGGKSLEIRKEVRRGPGDQGFILTTAFGPAGARHLHKHTQAWVDGETGRVRFRALDDGGGSVGGTIHAEREAELVWDFEQDGQAVRLRMTTSEPDVHRFAVLVADGEGAYQEQFHVDYERSDDV